MRSIFIVTSAIATRHGIYDASARFEQTVKTLESIRSKDPNAYIILVESSMERSISEAETNTLLNFSDLIINLHNDSELKKIYTIDSHDVVKNYSEMLMMIKIINYIQQNLSGYDRVFKLSGRYILTDKFDPEFYNGSDRIVFANRRLSQFPESLTGGLTQQFMCRLYSFPMGKLEDMKVLFYTILKKFTENYSKKIYTDLEHSMFRELGDKPDILEIPILGVSGNLGPNGEAVED